MADESTPIRAVKGFTVSRWEKLETQVAALQGSKGSILTQRVLSTLGLTERPTPLALNNAQIIKEPYFLLLYGDEEAIHESDLRPKHGAPPAVSQGIKQSLRDAYSTPRHPVNDWAQGQIDRLAIQLLQVFRTYVLIAPTDESGRGLPLEPAHVDTLLDHTKATRDAARELIVRLDMDFASKNAGRLAARIFEHTRCLDDKRFAPQDAWLAKKAAGKAHVDGDSWRYDDRGRHRGRAGDRGGRGGDRGGRGGDRGGRGGHGGRGKDRKRPRPDEEDHSS